MAYIEKQKRKKGFVYKAQVAHEDGSKVSRTFDTREAAESWGRGEEDVKRANRSSGVSFVRLLVNDYFEKWFDEYAKVHHSPGWQTTDVQLYRDYIKPIIGLRLLRDIQPVDIQRVMRNMIDQGLSAAYANRVRQMMSKMFTEAVKTYRYLNYNPVYSVRPFKEVPKKTSSLSQDEATTLLLWADGEKLGLAIHLGLNLGLREGEIVGLKWDAIELKQRRIEVRRKWERKCGILEEFTKGKGQRILGIYPDGLLERLRQQRERNPKSDFVIVNETGGMINWMQLTRLLKRGVKITQIRPVTMHGLRHTFASLYMENGGDLYDLQKIMGHQDVSTTERYRHTDPEYLRRKCQVTDLYSTQTPPKTGGTILKLVR
jgi:integrase